MAKVEVTEADATKEERIKALRAELKELSGGKEKQRTIKLTENPKQNVRVVAAYKLNRFVSAVKGIGSCCGPMFDYSDAKLTPKQIADMIRDLANIAADNIEAGNKPGTTNSGIRL